MTADARRAEDRRASQALYAEGRIDAAIEQIQALLTEHADSPDIDEHKLLSLFCYSKGDLAAALAATQRTHDLFPEDRDAIKNIAVVLSRMGRAKEALPWAQRVLDLEPDSPETHDSLAHIHGQLGDRDSARKHGEAALRLKDAEAAQRQTLCRIPDSPPPPFDPKARNRNVIAFSLWGDHPRYTEGALRNADLARVIYPEWRCRFYCGTDVAEDVIAGLLALGADVIRMAQGGLLYEGLFWRFEVASDPGISRFLVRDADSVVSLRERAAVEDWLASDKHFHVIRDYFTHTDLILAGLWGGVGGILPDLRATLPGYLEGSAKNANCDQKFLREVVWPVARQSVLAHDSWFESPGSRPFPESAVQRPGCHVGQDAGFEPMPEAGSFAVRTRSIAKDERPRRRRYVFTLTTGRSGTSYLAKLLGSRALDAEVHHERGGFRNLGRTTPDASHFTQFNAAGNVPAVREFWRRKLTGLKLGGTETYVETSHFLAKAGLLENLAFLGSEADIHVVVLDRDLESLVWSFANRMDFANTGFTWLFTLDPRYPRNIVDAEPLLRYGMFGSCLWYVMEMRARAAYYRRLLAQQPNLTFHKVNLEDIAAEPGAARLLDALGLEPVSPLPELPGRQNASQDELFNRFHRLEMRAMIADHPFDPDELAEAYLESGRRIGKPL